MRKGFTLLETVFAVAVFGLVIGMTMGSWLLFMHKSNRVNTQAGLDMDVRRVIERFRAEIRGTARETIIFYPADQEPYQAVGFAMAGSGTNGLVEMTADGSNILWRQSVVYHVWNQSPHQMRRTAFSNRNPDASYADRYNQIAAVVTAGKGDSACLSGESAQTMVMFENLHTGKLWHAEAKFDGYAPVANTHEKITFGSLSLGPGSHTISFKAAGKNAAASGYALRLDRLTASVGGWPLEAELRAVSGSSAGPYHVGQGLAGAAYGLKADMAAVGDTLSVTVLNDAIEECVFIGEGRNVAFSNTVVRFDLTNAPAPFNDGVFVAKLDGQYKTAWWGSVQASMDSNLDRVGRDHSGFLDYLFQPSTNYAIRIPIFGEYVRADGFGPVFRMYKSYYNGGLKIYDPAYAMTANLSNPSIEEDVPLVRLAFWQNGVKKSNWASCSEGGVDLRPEGLLHPIFAGQGLMFSCRIEPVTRNSDAIRAFDITTTPGKKWACWALPGATSVIAMQNDWSGLGAQPLYRDATRTFVPALVCMTVNFSDGGDYISHVFDTCSAAGAAKSFAWEADTPSGSTLAMYARSGDTLTADGFGIADAAAWENVAEAASGGGFSGNTGRYVQFRTVFTAQPASQYPGAGGLGSAGPYRSKTPKLRWARFTWDGEEKYVDVTADVLKSPDCGLFEVKVDGKPLVRGVTMEIEIFKDVLTQGGVKMERLRSAMTAEIEPRNSGK